MEAGDRRLLNPLTTASSIAHTICKWFVPKNVGALVKGVEVNQITKVMFCSLFGFRVRVWESYRTSRSFGYGHESLT